MLGLCRCFSPRARVQQPELGLIISLGSIAAFIMSPSLASKARQVKGGRAFASLWVIIAVQLLVLIGFPAGAGQGHCGVCNVLRISHNYDNCKSDTDSAVLSLMGSWGGDVNYGAARGMGLARLCAHIHIRRCAHRKARHGSADGRGVGHSRVSGGNTAAHQP